MVDLDIKVFVPNEININYHGEWVVQHGAMCYGIMLRKSDNKVKITYNINPENLHPDHFTQVMLSDVPSIVYRLFQQKLSKDIERADTTMTNLLTNKKILSELFNFAEENKTSGTADFHDAEAYTQEDAQKDQAMEAAKMQNKTKFLQQGPKKRRGKK